MTHAASAGQRRHFDLDDPPRSGHYTDRQVAGLRALSELGADDLVGGRYAPTVHPFPVGADRDYRRNDRRHSRRGAAVLQARQEPAGSLARDYAIPEIIFKPRRWLALLPVVVITAGSYYLHDTGSLQRIIADRPLLATWLATLAFIVIQLVLAWSQKPIKVNPRQQAVLDRLRVTVVIPCYNEDPQILDRTIVSLFRQTRLPDHIEVVDDGSTVDYSRVRDYWLAQPMPAVRFTWVRQRNAGKKHAQAVTFTSDHDADIFVTIDSDSALDRRAINEGLKPFADQRVVSVAGLETAINIDRNLLTRAIGHRSLVFQLFAMSAQSVARGSVLINPGAFSLYRATLIRKIVPSYLGETFFGVPVTLGDDTALTLYALLHGRAVHQPSAVALPVYPETIRMLWRLRYLPVLSYGWIFTVYTIASFLFSVAISIAIPLVWPASENLLLASMAAMVIWPLSISLRLATVRRSDQGLFSRLFGIALLPVAALWYLLVLRQIRFYGIATCWRQNWVTRQHVEVRLDGSHHAVPSNAPTADAAGPGHPVPHVSFYEGHPGDPRRGRDPRFGGTEVVHDSPLLRERDDPRYSRAFPDRGAPVRRVASRGGDGQNVRPLPGRAGDVPAAGQRPVRPQAGRGDQQRVRPQAGRGELHPSGAQARGRENGFDPRGYQNQRPPADGDRWAGQDRIPRDLRDVDPRMRGSQPPRDPRSSTPWPVRQPGNAVYDQRLASGAERGAGRYVPGSREDRQLGDGYGAPRSTQDRPLRPGRRRPADPRHTAGGPGSEPAYPQPGPDPRRLPDAQFGPNGQPRTQPRSVRNQVPGEHKDWAALEHRARQDDYDGGYTKEYRQ
jgi:hyaluronan synthase